METTDQPLRTAQASGRGTALHRQVFLILRNQIDDGVFMPGSVLPKEEALCDRFGVSRITVRRALADLASQGLVERRQGLGTFVRSDVPPPRAAPTLSLMDGLRRTADETEVSVLEVAEAEPPWAIAGALRLERSARALHVVRLRRIGDRPILLTDAWIPLDLSKRMTAAAFRKHALFELLQSQGLQLRRVLQEVTAVIAAGEVSTRLAVEPGSPLVKVIRIMHGRDERPVVWLAILLCPDRSRLLMDMPADQVDTLDAGRVVHDIR